MDYIWGLLKAINMLPAVGGVTLWRGCKAPITAFPNYRVGEEVTWYGFSSTSPDLQVQEEFTGKKGSRVLFMLHMRSCCGRDIKEFSMFPKESEVLLPPNVCFVVKAVVNLGNGLHQIQLEETEMCDPIMPQVSCGVCLGRGGSHCRLLPRGGGGGGQHSPGTPTTGLRERGNDTSKSTGRSGQQKAATSRNRPGPRLYENGVS